MELVAECEDEDGSLDLVHFKELYQQWLAYHENGGDEENGEGEGKSDSEHAHQSVSLSAPSPSPE